VHYAYDFERGSLLSVWRGPFADMVEIWGPRARNQTARPAGNQADRIFFTAPDTPGEYDYICSVPGHATSMKGILRVVRE
jgi:plastocyanin